MDYDRPLFYHVMAYAAEADRDVIEMVSGSPDWEPPAALRSGLAEYAEAEPDAFQYPPSEGLRGLREEIAARRNVDVERVIITNGAGEANYLAMAGAMDLFEERADGSPSEDPEFLLTDPVYPYYPGKADLLDATKRYVAAEPDGSLDPDAVREQAAASGDDLVAIVVNTPNNPTGAVYDRETVAALAEIAAEHDALLIADEVYDKYDYTGRFESALALDRSNVVVTNAFSKSMAITGFRVGYAILPESMVGGARTRHMLVNVATSRPAQQAVLDALRETGPEYYQRNRQLMADRMATFTDALDAAGADYTEPDGGFYVMARFEDFPGTLENVKRLVDEAGVAGMPGEAFGDARLEWVRFALVTPRVEEAADRLAAFFA
ncbi:aspartate/tyrosine/aromatic aminotransferase [Salinarchaeum sp. Harcht-Bsk1]|uniref:pyridoxal phosphate-dependent aminotransferase n=1 Tax=Salinarchaeum sp. Harcht-Bsk1 TaxID=1333523 RepID=UPI0003424367|nr:pyridoxal phosphate-dependent aminotransferase [Salinarchaeum sp. Harcht-Bsk1]AGN01814.1 aspartate/tyrosine/aromatic aminotransferase [Salinarchaeum sp. Harcht-Bsk1]